ncbi:hypothetical protein CPC08DRAFT_756070, partial [Agrocybe pediades]
MKLVHIPLTFASLAASAVSIVVPNADTPLQRFKFTWRLTALDPEGSLFNYLTTFGSEYLGPSGGCSTYGSLGFFPGAGSNKCARYGTGFYLHSNEENSQLGATLVYNWVGGFYACGSSKE